MQNIFFFIVNAVLLAMIMIGFVVNNNAINNLKTDSRAEFTRGIVANFNCENLGEFYLKSGDQVVGYKPICE